MKEKLFLCTFLFCGCTPSPTTIPTPSNKDYQPIDAEILVGVEPYSKTPKPTLKDEITNRNREECYERIRQNQSFRESQDYNHEKRSYFQRIVDDISCY